MSHDLLAPSLHGSQPFGDSWGPPGASEPDNSSSRLSCSLVRCAALTHESAGRTRETSALSGRRGRSVAEAAGLNSSGEARDELRSREESTEELLERCSARRSRRPAGACAARPALPLMRHPSSRGGSPDSRDAERGATGGHWCFVCVRVADACSPGAACPAAPAPPVRSQRRRSGCHPRVAPGMSLQLVSSTPTERCRSPGQLHVAPAGTPGRSPRAGRQSRHPGDRAGRPCSHLVPVGATGWCRARCVVQAAAERRPERLASWAADRAGTALGRATNIIRSAN